MTKSKEKQKPVLEEIRTFPAGRNRIAFFGIKKMPKKQKKTKQQSFLWFYAKHKPDNISLVEYLDNDGRKSIWLFPVCRKLTCEERLQLGIALLATTKQFSYNSIYKILDGGGMGKNPKKSTSHHQSLFNQEMRQEMNRQQQRYAKWRQNVKKTA